MSENMEKNKIDFKNHLISRYVKFTKICFEFKIGQLYEDITGSFNDTFDVRANWILTATKEDGKGVIVSCDFKLVSKNLDIRIIIQTKMEFDKKLSEEERSNTTFLQTLAANLFFPYLAELISSNTEKMGVTPIVIEYAVLDKIIEKTNEQGGFGKIVP